MGKNTSGFKNSILKFIRGEKPVQETFEHVNKPATLVYVSGTKGKTTVLNLVGHVLKENGCDFMWNISKENRIEPVASVLRSGKSVSGQIGCGLALMEVDEKDIVELFEKMTPDILVYTNIYAGYWNQKGHMDSVENDVDMSAFESAKLISGGNGYEIVSVDAENETFVLKIEDRMESYRLLGPTKADISDEAVAIMLLYQLGMSYMQISEGLKSAEKLTVCRHVDTVGHWKVFMCRGEEQSPAVCSHVLEWIGKQRDDCAVVLMDYNQQEQVRASENTAWLYEVDYEPLKRSGVRQVVTAGNRCYDYWVRLLLADINEERITCAFHPEDVVKLVDIEDVDNIYIIYGQGTGAKAKEIKEHLLQRIMKEGGIK